MSSVWTDYRRLIDRRENQKRVLLFELREEISDKDIVDVTIVLFPPFLDPTF